MTERSTQPKTKATKTKAKATKPKATKPKATKAKATKPKATKAKAKRKRKTKPSAAKAPTKAGVRLGWAEVVSRVIGEPAAPQRAPASIAELPATPQAAHPEPSQPAPPPTTIRFPAPSPKPAPAPRTFAADEWVSVTYCGEGVFVHGKAGIFAPGTTTQLRGEVASELANKPGFRVRRAA